MITYAKLAGGNWGIRAKEELEPGTAVTVTKKSGETKSELVGAKVSSKHGINFYEIKQKSRSRGCTCQMECCSPCRCGPDCNCRGGPIYDC